MAKVANAVAKAVAKAAKKALKPPKAKKASKDSEGSSHGAPVAAKRTKPSIDVPLPLPISGRHRTIGPGRYLLDGSMVFILEVKKKNTDWFEHIADRVEAELEAGAITTKREAKTRCVELTKSEEYQAKWAD